MGVHLYACAKTVLKTGGMAQWLECLPTCTSHRFHPPHHIKLGEAGGSEVEDHPWLDNETGARLC